MSTTFFIIDCSFSSGPDYKHKERDCDMANFPKSCTHYVVSEVDPLEITHTVALSTTSHSDVFCLLSVVKL